MKISEFMNEESLNLDITDLVLDSRLAKPGSLFFALKGPHYDGNQFIDDAIANGAVAIVTDTRPVKSYTTPLIVRSQLKHELSAIAEQFYGYPTKSLQIVGVTGTNGKTSCSHFIANALQQLNIPCGVIGTLGNGPYGRIQPGLLTTPDIITLQKTFAAFRDEGLKYVAMEVSSHGLDQGRVKNVPYSVGIFTNLTRDHLDYHGTMEAYGNAKKKLFINPLLKSSVVNYDDPFGREIISSLNNEAFIYSIKEKTLPGLAVTISDLKLYDEGMQAYVYTPWGKGILHTGLIGPFNLSNLLAVLTTLCVLDFPFEQALASIGKITAVPGRMERFGGKQKPLVVVDYSHTPDSLEKALKTLKAHCRGQLFCVFGCGGDRDRGKRPMMAAIAEQYADHIVVTDDNPRHEDPEKITDEIFQGFSHPERAILQHDRSKAIENVIQYAKPGDCVLIAGKGAEMYQLINDKKIPFSDAKEVILALGDLRNAFLD
jgi:UDP-N-acetylmuramoyl-L-alanyl-D-glutamate--2,6-diaminopimelate ligase